MTAFGQAFSHSIAHYSCQESLLQVMTRVRNIFISNEINLIFNNN